MSIKIKKYISIFLLTFILVSNVSMSAYASSGIKSSDNWVLFNDWSWQDKAEFYWDNSRVFFAELVGFVWSEYNGEHFSTDYIRNNIAYFWDEAYLMAQGCESYDEYIAKCLSMDDEGNIVVDDELVDVMHQISSKYIEEETGWYVVPTTNYKDISASSFANKATYDLFCTQIKNLDDDEEIYCVGGYDSPASYSSFGYYTDEDGKNQPCYSLYVCPSDYDYVGVLNTTNQTSTYCEYKGFKIYNSNWEIPSDNYPKLIAFNLSNPILVNSDSNYNVTTFKQYFNSTYNQIMYVGVGSRYSTHNRLITKDGHAVRVYKTLDDLKAYSVNQRPYFITDKFQDYDVNGDNSAIITESQLENSTLYGDVYNYITNNYGESANGLTESELMAILAEYLGSLNNGSGGSGSGSGSGSGLGGGLSGLLSGIGSLGDVLLSVVGKLIEILGKAIELVTGGLMDVITIIPDSISQLLMAIFPFFPEEWVTAITLSLILGVILGIVRIFK